MPLGNVPTLIFGSTGNTVVEGGGAPTPVVRAFCAPSARGKASENDNARGRMRFVMDEAARWVGRRSIASKMKSRRSRRQQRMLYAAKLRAFPFQFAYR